MTESKDRRGREHEAQREWRTKGRVWISSNHTNWLSALNFTSCVSITTVLVV
jgi:hypothetical protein